MTNTKVPPRVHHTLNALSAPIAFVPMVLITPDMMFTPHAIAATSTRLSVLPRPTSANEARYRATLNECVSFRWAAHESILP